MSYPINQKINPSMPPSTGLSSQQLQEIEAVKQGVNQGINQGIDNHPVTQAVKDNPVLKAGLTVSIWFGIAQLMNKFNKACATRTDGKPNLLDKVRDFGDKIGEHEAFKSGVFNKLTEFGTKTNAFLRKNVVDKSAILKAFFYTPTEPKSQMPRMMMKGTLGEGANDANQACTAYAQKLDGSYDLEKLKKLGTTAERLEEISKNDSAHIDEIIGMCKRMSPDEFVELAKAKSFIPGGTKIKKLFRDKILGEKIYTKLFGRRIYFSEMANKLEALKGVKGNYGKTYLGKALPKMFLRVAEGLTNGTVGGKLAMAMQAGCFADAIIRTINAPKGEKTKTFAESSTQDLAFYLMIPSAILLMHRFGGLKYIGLNKEGVENYRKALTEFNKKAASGDFAGKTEYKQARKVLKDMLKGDTKLALKTDGAGKTIGKSLKNIVHKPLKLAASVMTIGLETKTGFLGQGADKMQNFFKDFGSMFKKGAGFPVRLILGFMVFLPFLSNIAVRCCHLVFGRPTKSLLDKEEDEKPKKEQQVPQLAMPQPQIQPQTITQVQPQQATQTQPQEPSQASSSQTEKNESEDELINKKAA